MRPFLRYLRLAFSATCLIACVLLIALWVRSYWENDMGYFPLSTHRMVVLGSDSGSIGVSSYLPIALQNTRPWRTGIVLTGWGRLTLRITHPRDRTYPYFAAGSDDIYLHVRFPHWIAVFFASTLAALPWLPWWSKRFSLRTLLIATTLVAVVLGLAVWSIH
jgi:hypothetical protein